MKILQVCGWWEVAEQGGVTSVMADLTETLESRHEVLILTSDWGSPQVSTHSDGEREYYKLRMPRPPDDLNPISWVAFALRFPVSVVRLITFCRESGVDVAHLHFLAPYQACFALASLMGGPPYIVTIHRGDILAYPTTSRGRRLAMRSTLRLASCTTAVSDWLSGMTQELSRVKKRPVTVYNGVRLDDKELPSRDDVEKIIGRSLPANYAVLAANMRPYKAHDIALKAWKILSSNGFQLPLVLAGGGPDFSKMKSLALDLGLEEDQVIFLGPCKRDVALALIRDAGFLVAPSRSEGHSIAILEAALLGTPIVSSDIDPFLETIRDGETGFIFKVDDERDMARAVLSVISDAEEAAMCASRLSEEVAKRFSLEAMTASYERLYTEAVSDRSRRSASIDR